jgi:3-deoxy-manno-octulosonate cytidylyltransferase (CMP-KDO synthetase)
MPVTIIIPARLASTRFPEKVLAARTGRPLVQHVAEAAAKASCSSGGQVVVAADHERIAAALRPFGTRVVMTRADHPNGTSRLAEAAASLGLGPDDVVVNAQGDEPEMAGEVIDLAVAALESGPHQVGSVAAPFGPGDDPANPNIVKVVRRIDGSALYFSRALIPFDRDQRNDPRAQPLRHIGVYAYRRAFLEKYVTLPPTPLEQAEQLEQLRVLEHGYSIGVQVCKRAHAGIDTPEQYEQFVKRWNAGGR